MNYPDTPGAQAHSETSISAAAKVNTKTLYGSIIGLLKSEERRGAVCDEIGSTLLTPNSTIGARLRELELQGRVIKTKRKRKTSYDRDAFVYVHPRYWIESDGKATIKAKPTDVIKLEVEHARMKKALNDIWGIAPDLEINALCKEGLGL